MDTLIFAGGIRPLPPENRPTGIFKRALETPMWLGREGLAGDAQADRRVHGGPEKALHQYPQGHYARLAATFPGAAELLVPGSIGENLSVPGWDEDTVSIGDVFWLGDALIEVSQPRTPCWKIDHRYGVEGMARHIDELGLTGWYCRVLEEGAVEPGCRFERVERRAPEVTLAKLLALYRAPYPDAALLQAYAAAPGLAPNWVAKLAARLCT